MSSNGLAKPETNTKAIVKRTSNKRSKNNLKAGSVHKNIEINDKYLDEIFHIINLKMELAMQNISKHQTIRSNTVQDLKEFNSQCLSIQVKKGEKIVSMMSAIKKAFDSLGDDIVELSTKKILKTKAVTMMKIFLEKSKTKLLKQTVDEERAKLYM